MLGASNILWRAFFCLEKRKNIVDNKSNRRKPDALIGQQYHEQSKPYPRGRCAGGLADRSGRARLQGSGERTGCKRVTNNMHKHIYFFLGAAAVGFALAHSLADKPVFSTAYTQGQKLAVK